MTGCAGAGEVPHTLLPQELLFLPTSAEPWLASPSRNRTGSEGNVAPCAAARGRLHHFLPPARGRAVPRASPCHTHKECRTRSMACEPGTLAASSIPLKGWTTDPPHPIPRGICHMAGRTLVRPLPPPCTQIQAWKSCKENMESWSPDLTQQHVSSSAHVLHGEVIRGLGLGFIHLVDPGALTKQLFGVFVCSKKVLLQSVEAKHTPNSPRVLCKMVIPLCWRPDSPGFPPGSSCPTSEPWGAGLLLPEHCHTQN